MQNVTRVQVNRPKTNSWLSFTIVPTTPISEPSPVGSNGGYTVTFYLSVPGKNVFTDEINVGSQTGDSLLSIRNHLACEFSESNGDVFSIRFHRNSEGRISNAQTIINANNFNETEKTASDLIFPLLSWFSFQHDVALEVKSCEIEENITGTRKVSLGVIGEVKPFIEDSSVFLMKEELGSLFSTYREALNATSPFYQFLCFYKVVENINYLRHERSKAAKARNEQPSQLSQRVPQLVTELANVDEDFHSSFTPYLGDKFTKVCDKFRDILRNAIAHVDPRQKIQLNDRFQDVTECLSAIPVIKYIAREMIRTEISLDTEFQQIKPTIV